MRAFSCVNVTGPWSEWQLATEMKPLLHHASRSITTGFSLVAASSRPVGEFGRVSTCLRWRCQYRAASTTVRNNSKAQRSSETPPPWSRRLFSSSSKRTEEKNSPQPITMPPPTTEPKSINGNRAEESVEERARKIMASIEEQKRLLGAQNTQTKEQDAHAGTESVAEQQSTLEAQQQLQEDSSSKTKKNDVSDNIERVPDEQLPSHRERQRWDLSKRLSELMDQVLPKLAVVTQKVNTYTGTDYSGVEALRREIKEQGRYLSSCTHVL
jgi:sensitive to high expression protein 9